MTGLEIPTKTDDDRESGELATSARAARLRAMRWRLGIVLALSLLLHALLIGYLRLHEFVPDGRPPLSAVLVPTPAAPPPPAPHLQRPPLQHQVPRSAPQPLATAPSPDPLPALTSSQPSSAEIPSGAPGTGTGPRSSGEGAAGTASNQAASAALGTAPAASPAESVLLRYDVIARDPQRDPNQGYGGSGTLDWKLKDHAYTLDFSIEVVALILRFQFLETHSSGGIDEGGLVPQHYSEKPRNHAPSNLDLSAGNAQRRLQDRTSVIVQIGAMLRADSALAQPGAQFNIDVMALDGAIETWQFKVIGNEEVSTNAGRFASIHVARVLRPGSHDRGVELWLTPARGDYPVRILYTEPNQSYIDLRLAG
jgi:hypothetical protein